MPKFDAVAVNLKTNTVRSFGQDKNYQDADAICKMAIMRRGLDEEFYSVVPAGMYSEGDKWREGYIVWTMFRWPCEIGEVVEELWEDGIIPGGTKMVIKERISLEEAQAWARRSGLPNETEGKFFYKAVAE